MDYRSALITGATSGIGAAFARELPSSTSLLLTGRRADRLEALAADLENKIRRIATVPGDLASPGDREGIIRCAREAEIDLFICNAGLGLYSPFVQRAEILEEIEVNVVAFVDILHGLLPDMISRARQERRRCGVIVVTSMAAFGPYPGLSSYNAAKAFQMSLTDGLAIELRHDPIDILALCPSYTATEFFARAGLPQPPWAMPPDLVARKTLRAIGRRKVFFPHSRNQTLSLVLTRNPILTMRHMGIKRSLMDMRDRLVRRNV